MNTSSVFNKEQRGLLHRMSNIYFLFLLKTGNITDTIESILFSCLLLISNKTISVFVCFFFLAHSFCCDAIII